MIAPELGEDVLVVPQAWSYLTNPHDTRNVLGQFAHTVRDQLAGAYWEPYSRNLLRVGYGLLVVRDGRFASGPTNWDSGD